VCVCVCVCVCTATSLTLAHLLVKTRYMRFPLFPGQRTQNHADCYKKVHLQGYYQELFFKIKSGIFMGNHPDSLSLCLSVSLCLPLSACPFPDTRPQHAPAHITQHNTHALTKEDTYGLETFPFPEEQCFHATLSQCA